MNIAYHELMNGGTLMIDPEQGRQRGLRDHPRRQAERLRDPRRRLAEELLPPGAADALGGLRHPQGRQRLLHPDHDRPGRLGRPVGRDAGRGGQLGQGQPGRAARHGRRLLRLDDRLSAVLRVRRRLRRTTAGRARSWCTSATRSSPTCCGRRRTRRPRRRRSDDHRGAGGESTATADGDAVLGAGPARRAASPTSRASMPTRTCPTASSPSCARSSDGTCSSCWSTTTCAAPATSSTTAWRGSSAARWSRSIATTSTTGCFPPEEGAGVIVFCAPDERWLRRLLDAHGSRAVPRRGRAPAAARAAQGGVAHRCSAWGLISRNARPAPSSSTRRATVLARGSGADGRRRRQRLPRRRVSPIAPASPRRRRRRRSDDRGRSHRSTRSQPRRRGDRRGGVDRRGEGHAHTRSACTSATSSSRA